MFSYLPPLTVEQFHNRKNVASFWKRIQGREVAFERKHIDIQASDDQYTVIILHNGNGSFQLYQYRGEHSSEPESQDKLAHINIIMRKSHFCVVKSYKVDRQSILPNMITGTRTTEAGGDFLGPRVYLSRRLAPELSLEGINSRS